MPAFPPIVAIPSVPCPTCGHRGTALVSVSIGDPEPGDLVICLLCGEVNIFTPDLTLRVFVAADFDAYDLEDLARIIQIICELRAVHERRN